MTVRTAIFGNSFARSVILPALRHVPDCEVVGIASPSAEKLERTARDFGIEAFEVDHAKLLARTSPDWVIVATPPFRHLDQSIDALEAGAHVLCEKPTALDQAQSAAMLSAATRHSPKLALIDHELRFDPKRRRVRELVSGGRIGRPLHVSYRLHSFGLWRVRPWSWWYDASRGGGTLGAIGSHVVDALRDWFEPVCGPVRSVLGDLKTLHESAKDDVTGAAHRITADEMTRAWLDFESGLHATIEISLSEAERVHELTIVGDEGAIRLREQGPLEFAALGTRFEPLEVVDDLPSNQELEIPDTDWARSFVRYAREIVEAIATGRSGVRYAATFEDGHANQILLDAIRASSDERREVNLSDGQIGRGLPL